MKGPTQVRGGVESSRGTTQDITHHAQHADNTSSSSYTLLARSLATIIAFPVLLTYLLTYCLTYLSYLLRDGNSLSLPPPPCQLSVCPFLPTHPRTHPLVNLLSSVVVVVVVLCGSAYIKTCGDPNQPEFVPSTTPQTLSCVTDIKAYNGYIHIMDRALPFDPIGDGSVPGVDAPVETMTDLIAEDEENALLECAISVLDGEGRDTTVPLSPPATYIDQFEAVQSACGRKAALGGTGSVIPKCALDCRINNVIIVDGQEIGARTGCNEGTAAACSSRQVAFGTPNAPTDGNLGSVNGAIGTCDNGYTVFSPKDAAWLDLPAGIREFLLVSQFEDGYANLRTIVRNHISELTEDIDNTILYLSDIRDYLALNETAGDVIPELRTAAYTAASPETWNITGLTGTGTVFVNGVPVVVVDAPAMNGVKHTVDGLVFPNSLRDKTNPAYTMPTRPVVEVVQNSPFYTWNGNFQDDGLDASLNCTTRFPEIVEAGTCTYTRTFFRPSSAAVQRLRGAGLGTTTDALTYIENHPDVAKKFIQARIWVLSDW